MAPPSAKKQKTEPVSSKQDIMNLLKKPESVASSDTRSPRSTVPGSPAPGSASSLSTGASGTPAPFTPVSGNFAETALQAEEAQNDYVPPGQPQPDAEPPGQPQPDAEPRSAKKNLDRCLASLFATGPTGADNGGALKVLVLIPIRKHE
jgi:hypothetical protein